MISGLNIKGLILPIGLLFIGFIPSVCEVKSFSLSEAAFLFYKIKGL